jgi:hypothetical protein
MKPDPFFVSIITPVYNGEAFLAKAVESVQRQNDHPLEIIIVDDGSTDGTASVVASLQPDTSIRGEDTSPVVFFETVHRAFQRAEQVAGGSLDRFYTIGGYVIQLRFAGPALVPRITPALEHLATEPTSPVLTVCLWDSTSTRTNMPPPPWTADTYAAHGNVYSLDEGRVHYHDDRIQMYFYMGDYVLMIDTKSALAIFWIRDARQLPYYESGAPLRTLLHWWLSNHGRQFVHAAAVGTAKGGVLLAGKGGSGKSTTALACLNSELLYVSDDYCLLATDPVPYVYSLYSSAKVDADNIHRLPHLAFAISNADRLDTEKALLFLHEHCPEKIETGFPIHALLLPRVTGRSETTLTPASPITGLKALAPSTLFQLPGAGHTAFQVMSKFVKQVPCYHLELGTDLAQIPEVILGLLSKD